MSVMKQNALDFECNKKSHSVVCYQSNILVHAVLTSTESFLVGVKKTLYQSLSLCVFGNMVGSTVGLKSIELMAHFQA